MSAVSGSETEQVVVAPGVRPPLAVPRRLLRLRSDAALAERFAAGDEAAFDVIYERHRPVVLAVCMGVLGAPPDAEDATQETFSALAVALRTRPPAELRPWLIRVARNASIDTTRRRRHRLLTLDGEIPEVAARPISSGKAELAVVLDGIRELPEGQRMALLMRELGGHSYSEIAEFLETDEESVKGLIARARVGLRTYREATELSCATARTTIAAEPDGRRYNKTIRRHLRTCGSCRSYREALRDDAKALRAALPIQAGTVATGSLSSGMLSTAKGSLLGYGLTQAATTCAASACAVGAIGGMVFVAPVPKLGLPALGLPAAKTVKAAPHKHHAIAKAGPAAHVVLPVHTAATVYRSAAPVHHSSATTMAGHAKPAHPSTAVVQHRHHEPTVTKVHLHKLPPVHKTTAKAPAPSTVAPVSSVAVDPAPSSTSVSTSVASVSSSSATSVSSSSSTAAGSAAPATQPGQGQSAGHPTGDPNSTAQSGGGSPSGVGQGSHSGDGHAHPGGDHNSQSGTGSGSRPVGGGRHDGPVHVLIGGAAPPAGTASASAASAGPASAGTAPATGSAAGATTTTASAPTTTSPSTTRPGSAHGPIWTRDQSGERHGGSGHPSAPAQPATPASTSSTPVTPVTPTTSSTSSTSTVSSSAHGWSGGNGPAQTWGRDQQTGSGNPQSGRGPHWGSGGR